MSGVVLTIQQKIKELSLQRKLDGKSIFLFGHNKYTEYINNFLYNEGYRLCGIIDNDKEKQKRKVCNISIYAPENIKWKEQSIAVLIASRHKESMVKQICQLSNEAEIFILIDLFQWDEQWEKKQKFWLEENYEDEIRKLHRGAEAYKRLKGEESIFVLPFPSIGDTFLAGVFFSAYQLRKTKKIKVIVGSKGAYRVIQMFGIMSAAVPEQEQEALYKYMCFCGGKSQDESVCSWTFILETMARYKGFSFTQFIARYLFRLGNNYQRHFPSIWDKQMKETEFADKGLIKGKSVILSPYANSTAELPWQFWECLAEKLLEKNYCVFTNIVGNQKPLRNSVGLEIPLEQLGSYLEYAGYFIALRSGLCDIAGHSLCRQIVIFRDGYIAPNSSWIAYYDLHPEEISESAVQYIYDDNDFFKNIDMVMNYVANR